MSSTKISLSAETADLYKYKYTTHSIVHAPNKHLLSIYLKTFNKFRKCTKRVVDTFHKS